MGKDYGFRLSLERAGAWSRNAPLKVGSLIGWLPATGLAGCFTPPPTRAPLPATTGVGVGGCGCGCDCDCVDDRVDDQASLMSFFLQGLLTQPTHWLLRLPKCRRTWVALCSDQSSVLPVDSSAVPIASSIGVSTCSCLALDIYERSVLATMYLLLAFFHLGAIGA
jgi:hypothetical protein